jgi:FkbM family methyltransferase
MILSKSFKLALKKKFPRPVYSYLDRKQNYVRERHKILNHLNANVLFDVGANIGLYAHSVRHHGFSGRILSFEPQTKAFKELEKFADNDGLWEVFNFALGNENKKSQINISANSVSSSILDISARLHNVCPQAGYIDSESIEIRRLDDFATELCNKEDKIFVKADTQGYEFEVVEGCLGCLDQIVGFQLEMSLIELYRNEKTFLDIVTFMDKIGYRIATIEPGWNDPKTGYCMELDGIFVKK